MKKHILRTLMGVSVLLAGCATHKSEIEAVRTNYMQGDFAQAEAEVSKVSADKVDSGDELIWLLEEGAVARANNNLKKSIESFDKALAKIEDFEKKAETSLSNETKALLTNQSYIPYKGSSYDKIMLTTYQLLNFIELKDFDKAYGVAKKLEKYQDEAEAKNKEKIAKETKAIEDFLKEEEAKENPKQAKQAKQKDKEVAKTGANYDISNTLKDGNVSAVFNQHYGDEWQSKKENEALAENIAEEVASIYKNPYSTWLTGIFYAARAESSSDRESAAQSIGSCNKMLAGKSKVLKADVLAVEEMANKQKAFGNVTYVVYEAGVAPLRSQFRLDLPIFLVAKNFPHIAVNFPYLTPEKDYKKDLSILANGKAVVLETIVSMDDVIKNQFNADLPLIITKTVISSAFKASAQYIAASAAGEYGKFVHLGMAVYQAAMNDADLRTWTTLPKEVKLARVETPADGKITVEGKVVDVNKEGVNIVFVKKTSSNANPVIRKIDFKDAPKPATTASK